MCWRNLVQLLVQVQREVPIKREKRNQYIVRMILSCMKKKGRKREGNISMKRKLLEIESSVRWKGKREEIEGKIDREKTKLVTATEGSRSAQGKRQRVKQTE